MCKKYLVLAAAAIAMFAGAGSARAVDREAITVESATEVLTSLSAIPERGIPPHLLRDAQGVAIIPGVIKAGLVIGGCHGRGIVLLRQPDGSWSNPVFITLTGGSIGWQIGVQSTDVVLVFKTRSSLNRIIQGKGKVTLGADIAVAAGPVGRRAEAGTDGQLKAEIYSYSRSRGLFAGVSLEGAAMVVDCLADEAFYRIRDGRPADVLNFRGPVPLCVHNLRVALGRMSGAPVGPVEFVAPPVQAPVPLPLPAPRPVPVEVPPGVIPPGK